MFMQIWFSSIKFKSMQSVWLQSICEEEFKTGKLIQQCATVESFNEISILLSLKWQSHLIKSWLACRATTGQMLSSDLSDLSGPPFGGNGSELSTKGQKARVR